MKKINAIKYLTMLSLVGLFCLTGCNDPIYDFGYNGQLSGRVVDASGNVVSGDIKQATYAVDAMGELDLTSMILRIQPDGTYANSKLYPQAYEVKLVGPFLESPTDPVRVDLSGNQAVVKDFQVTPFLTVSLPSVSGSPTPSAVEINFSITPNGGKTANLREIYVSTVAWPTRTTGTGKGYSTKTATVDENEGTATVSGLEPNTKYYVRVGARADGQNLFNHSEQISITTPN